MSLKTRHRLRDTLAFRLTLWYAGIFTFSSLVAFTAYYLLARSELKRQTDQELLNELTEYSSLLSIKGLETLKTVIALEAESEGIGNVFFRILTPEGDVLTATNMSTWGEIGVGRACLKRLSEGGNPTFETLNIPRQPYQARILYGTMGSEKILQIGLSLAEKNRFMSAFLGIFSKLLVLLMFFAGLTGWFMAKRALKGVEEITRTAMHISDGALEMRVSLKGKGEEIDRLGNAFNRMLDRIHALLTGMRKMTDHIAHDLRTPITRIRGIAEVTLISEKSLEEYRSLAAKTIEECDRLLEVINTTLDISEAEAGVGRLKMDSMDFSRLVREALDLFQPVAEDKGIRVLLKVPEHCPITGDVRKLQRMTANLLDNALKYTQAQGSVEISLNCEGERVALSIRDSGIGIPPEDLPHIFKRFYRCDKSRSEPGAGLGLSLALAIARAHGGDIRVTSSPGEGSLFTVHLPRIPSSS